MTLSSVVTLANSIIGVSILAMPYCFKQCGIILATIMILLSGMLVKVTCHLMLKSALLARRRNFENLAFHTFGHSGKLLVELGIIGYLAGTAIAFFVVMGDLGPPIVASFANIANTANLRLVILTGLGLFVALPLSLIRNIESLQYICTASIGFYLMTVLRVVLQAGPHLVSSEWLSVVNLWRPAGMLQCFPIFSMALSCQVNIFEVYASLPDATPAKMNDVVKGAVNLCTAIYITIGFFGYVAFCYTDFAGDILTAFPHTTFLELIKFGFCISVAISFPLVLFPCRTSLHSLLFRKTYQGIGSTELVSDYIPPTRFNMITGCLIVVTLIVGILIPDIELVLGLVGSTMGSCICVIFPGMVFLKLTNKDTTERLAARAVVGIGLITLILGTYVNLQDATAGSSVDQPGPEFIKPLPVDEKRPKHLGDTKVVDKIEKDASEVLKNISAVKAEHENVKSKKADNNSGEKRQEPAVPEAPAETKSKDTVLTEAEKEKIQKKVDDANIKSGNLAEEIKSAEEVKSEVDDKLDIPEVEVEEKDDLRELIPQEFVEELVVRDKKESDVEVPKTPVKEVKAEKLIKELEKQKEESKKILDQQKEILEELKEHQKKDQEAEVLSNNVQPIVPAQNNQNINLNPQEGPKSGLVQPQQINEPNLLQNQPIYAQQQVIQQPIAQQQIQQSDQQQVLQQPVGQQQVRQEAVAQQQNVQQFEQPIIPQQQGQPQPVQQQQQGQQVQQNLQPLVHQPGLNQQPVNQQPPAQQSFGQRQQQQPAVQQIQQQQPALQQFQQQQQPVVQQIQQQQPVVQQIQQQQPVVQQIQQQQPVVQQIQQQQPVVQQIQQQQPVVQQIQQQQPVVKQVQQQQPAVQQFQQPQPAVQQIQQQQPAVQQFQQQQPAVQPFQQQQPVVQQPVVQQIQQQQPAVQQVQQQQPAVQQVQQQQAGHQPQVNSNALQQPLDNNAPQQPIVSQSNQLQGNPAVGAHQNIQTGVGAPLIKQTDNNAPVDGHLIQAAVKHGLEAYDREQVDIHKPVEIPKEDQLVPGRDLKGDRSKRSALEEFDAKVDSVVEIKAEKVDLICLNDPFCDDKFSRNPVSDSLIDRDLTKFMKVGKRSLLKVEPDTNFTDGDSRSL